MSKRIIWPAVRPRRRASRSRGTAWLRGTSTDISTISSSKRRTSFPWVSKCLDFLGLMNAIPITRALEARARSPGRSGRVAKPRRDRGTWTIEGSQRGWRPGLRSPVSKTRLTQRALSTCGRSYLKSSTGIRPNHWERDGRRFYSAGPVGETWRFG